MASLEQLMDFQAVFPPEWSKKEHLSVIEAERLRFDFESALCLSTIPRRLGIIANPHELAADKQLGRKMANVALRALQWRGADLEWMHDYREAAMVVRRNGRAYQEGAQRLWTPWYYDRLVWIDQHIPVVACWAVKEGNRTEGNHLCQYLKQERDLLTEVWHKTAPRQWFEPDDRPLQGDDDGN